MGSSIDEVAGFGVRMGGQGGVGIGIRDEVYMLVLEVIISSRVKDAPMDHLIGVFSQDLEGHCITNIGSNANPPTCFLFSGRKRLVRVKINFFHRNGIPGKQRCLGAHHVEVLMGSDTPKFHQNRCCGHQQHIHKPIANNGQVHLSDQGELVSDL